MSMQPGLSEFKLHLRLVSDDQDAMLLSYLKAATRAAEHQIGRCLAPSRFVKTCNFASEIVLDNVCDLYPIQGSPVVYVDGTACTNFSVVDNRIVFGTGVTGAVVRVTYTAGARKAEPDIKVAILLIAAKYFNNPVDPVQTLPSAAYYLLAPYRTWNGK